jgi:hypothetical protein
MKVETAIRELNRQAKFLGMTAPDVLVYIRENPLANPLRAVEAQRTYDDYREVMKRIIG